MITFLARILCVSYPQYFYIHTVVTLGYCCYCWCETLGNRCLEQILYVKDIYVSVIGRWSITLRVYFWNRRCVKGKRRVCFTLVTPQGRPQNIFFFILSILLRHIPYLYMNETFPDPLSIVFINVRVNRWCTMYILQETNNQSKPDETLSRAQNSLKCVPWKVEDFLESGDSKLISW